MSDMITAALLAGGVSLVSSILTFIVGIRSVSGSVATSNGLPLGVLMESRISQIDRLLEGVEQSLADMRERLAFEEGAFWRRGLRWDPR